MMSMTLVILLSFALGLALMSFRSSGELIAGAAAFGLTLIVANISAGLTIGGAVLSAIAIFALNTGLIVSIIAGAFISAESRQV